MKEGKYIGILGALALIAYIGFAGGLIDFFFPDPPAPVSATDPYLPYLSHPLGCNATVNGRCYVATSEKVAR